MLRWKVKRGIEGNLKLKKSSKITSKFWLVHLGRVYCHLLAGSDWRRNGFGRKNQEFSTDYFKLFMTGMHASGGVKKTV